MEPSTGAHDVAAGVETDAIRYASVIKAVAETNDLAGRALGVLNLDFRH